MAMDLLTALRSRRSIGKVAGDVTDDELRTLVDAALCAPNHKLTEPWRFTALRGEARARLGEVWAEVAAASAPADPAARDAALEKERRKPLRAPLLLVASVRTDSDPVVAEEDFAAGAAAVQNVLLAAHALGLGAMWRTGAMVRSDAVKAHLGLDPSDRIVGIVYVGRPAMEPPAERPRDVDAVLRERR
jgi:nitroreductase